MARAETGHVVMKDAGRQFENDRRVHACEAQDFAGLARGLCPGFVGRQRGIASGSPALALITSVEICRPRFQRYVLIPANDDVIQATPESPSQFYNAL
jgi:hypothetical protein